MTINNASEGKSVTILGSTGSIGQNTLKVMQDSSENFSVISLTANKNVNLLAKQAIETNANFAVIADDSLYTELKSNLSGTNIKAMAGTRAINEASQINSDFVMSSIVGVAALEPTLEAIKRGCTIGLANKECLVCAGEIMIEQAKLANAKLIPVDSEHNAIYQAFDFKKPGSIANITLTASGGPFRTTPIGELDNITPEQAVKHPNWNMGAKISVDSATMMNKGLEIIEAYHLFPISSNQIKVIIHPQSVIHGMVNYIDGSSLAQFASPDMRVPISYALAWPNRINTKIDHANLAELGKLTFQEVDHKRFPAVNLAYNAMNDGGIKPLILNIANEEAVKLFLNNKIGFNDIISIVNNTLENMENKPLESIAHAFDLIDQIKYHINK